MHRIRKHYITTFVESYSKYIKQKLPIDIEMILKVVIEDILEFVFMFVEGMVKFYKVKLFSSNENESNNIHWLI